MGEVFGAMNPLLVIVMIIGLVELSKQLGVSGKGLLGLSMTLGVFIGSLFQVGMMYPEVAPWIEVVVYGVMTGLAASGIYDWTRPLIQRPSIEVMLPADDDRGG